MKPDGLVDDPSQKPRFTDQTFFLLSVFSLAQ